MGKEDVVSLKEFNMDDLEPNSTIVLVGMRRSGKSFLLRNILYHHRDFPLGTCISGTEHASPFFRYFLPKPFIHNRYSPAIVSNALKRQELIKKRLLKEKDPEVRKSIDTRAFLILDDCIYDKMIKKDPCIGEIFMNGRHFDLMFIITMQYPLGIPPEMRTNVDYTFIFREPNLSNRKRIYENYASCIPTFQMFNQIMDLCTEDFGCVVIKTLSTKNNIEDQVFYYKAPKTNNFRVGDEHFWNLPQDSSDDEDDQMLSQKQILSSKGHHVRVKKKKDKHHHHK